MPANAPLHVRRALIARLFLFIVRYLQIIFRHYLPPMVAPIALLIDGDNNSDMSAELLAQILVEAGKFGGVTIRRVYGNWGMPTMGRWKDLSSYYALQPVHYMQTTTSGKNAADIALAIDAVDLLRCNGITHFCLVASDSDYLPLVRRLRENGCFVMIIGKGTAVSTLTRASTVFIALEGLGFKPVKSARTLSDQASTGLTKLVEAEISIQATAESVTDTEASQNSDGKLAKLLLIAYELAAREPFEWITIQRFSAAIKQQDPAFKPMDYQHKNFPTLIQAYPTLFETRKQSTGHLAIRKKGPGNIHE